MVNPSNIEEQLWSYIDGNLPNEEMTLIDQLIQENAEWKAKYKELLSLQDLLTAAETDMPSMRFTMNVMDQIRREQISPAAKSYLNKKIIGGIAGFVGLMLLTLLVYAITRVRWSSGSSTAISERLDRVDWSFFSGGAWVNGLLMISIIVGLMMLDRVLATRRKQMHSNHS